VRDRGGESESEKERDREGWKKQMEGGVRGTTLFITEKK
jgi:hypothetical protein